MCIFAGQNNRVFIYKMIIMKKPYSQPDIVRSVSLHSQAPVLQGSVVDNITQIESIGQTVGDFDYSTEGSGFNLNWDED